MGSGTNVRSGDQLYSSQDPLRLPESHWWMPPFEDTLLRWLICSGAGWGQDEAGLPPGLKDQGFFGEVFKLGLAKSIHHTWVFIRRYHIRVHKHVVNIWSFIVLLASQKHIYNFSLCVPYRDREASWRGSTPKRARVELELVMTRRRIKSAHPHLDWWII